MNAKIVKDEHGDDGRSTYEIEATGVALAIEFYPGDPEAGERPWHADIRFVVAGEELDGEDVNPRAAFLAAASRHETMVRGGRPMPAVAWSEIEQALEAAGAFAHG